MLGDSHRQAGKPSGSHRKESGCPSPARTSPTRRPQGPSLSSPPSQSCILYFIWQLHLVPFTEFILYLLICNIILLFFRFMYIWTLPYSLFCFNICIFSSLLITFLSELLTSTSRSMLNHSIVKLGIFVLFLILVGPLLVIPH